jgi:hypothetical protein
VTDDQGQVFWLEQRRPHVLDIGIGQGIRLDAGSMVDPTLATDGSVLVAPRIQVTDHPP